MLADVPWGHMSLIQEFSKSTESRQKRTSNTWCWRREPQFSLPGPSPSLWLHCHSQGSCFFSACLILFWHICKRIYLILLSILTSQSRTCNEKDTAGFRTCFWGLQLQDLFPFYWLKVFRFELISALSLCMLLLFWLLSGDTRALPTRWSSGIHLFIYYLIINKTENFSLS